VKFPISRLCLAAAGVTLCHATIVSGSLVFVPNGNFAAPDQADDTFSDTIANPSGAVPDWTFVGGDNGVIAAGVWDPISQDYPGADGNNATLPGAALTGQTGFISLEQLDENSPQPLGGTLMSASSLVTIASNTSYTLTVALGRSLTFPDHGDVTIQLRAGNDVIASEFVEQNTLTTGTFTDFSTSFTTTPNSALAGMPLTVGIVHNFGGADFVSVDFTNVRLDVTQVPEPTTSFALLGIGIIVARRARRA
jgi:hypothetical protein